MKDSRRSDRELARAIDASQPTVSRLIAKLKKGQYITEHTIIPNFNKLGYHVFALTFFNWKAGTREKEKDAVRKWTLRQAESAPNNIIVIERGMGLGYEYFMASFHRNYTSYTELLDYWRENPYIDIANMGSFIVNLDDENHYRYLTFSTLAKHLMESEEREVMARARKRVSLEH